MPPAAWLWPAVTSQASGEPAPGYVYVDKTLSDIKRLSKDLVPAGVPGGARGKDEVF